MAQSRTWLDVRGRGYFLAVAIASLAALLVGHGVYTLVTAKAPGETHCYGGVCHRVYTLDETARMIGKPLDLLATHYDWPEFDKFNVGQYTSSGEEFDAGNAARVSASNFPDGTELLLWHASSKRASHVRVNDFGPFKSNRTLDVTRRNAEVMGWAQNGVATLRVTVIWVPSPAEARYRKARVYPPSLGLIGVVEPHQYDALAQTLIRTAVARNGGGGDGLPNAVALLASIPQPAPQFRTEAAANAADATAREAAAGQVIARNLPAFAMAPVPFVPPFAVASVPPVATNPPAFRSEAVVDAPQAARDAAVAVAAMLSRLPQPDIDTALPAELLPPVVVAVVAPPAPSVAASTRAAAPVIALASPPMAAVMPPPMIAPAAVPETTPAVPPAATPEPAPRELSTVADETGAGRFTANRPTIAPSIRVPGPVVATFEPEAAAPLPQAGGPSVGLSVAQPGQGAPPAAREPAVEREVVVASARVTQVPERTWSELPAVWIGIGLMMSLLGGAFARSWRGKAAVPVQQMPSRAAAGASRLGQDRVDPLALARDAAERAEARAKAALLQETTRGPAASEAEIVAREELARELEARELESEREVAARSRLAATAAEHDRILREIEAIESARTRRIMSPEIAGPRLAAAAPVAAPPAIAAHPEEQVQVQPAPKPVLAPEPPRAVANDREMAGFPGLTDRALVGGIIGLPGAAGYWGNTIIAQMRLEGSAKSGSPLRIDGKVDGAVMAPVLLISEDASVNGIAAAETVVVLGRVTGTISARRVFVAATAQVEGEIYYESISIDPQAHCDVSFSRLPKEADPVALASSVYDTRAA